MNVTSTELLGVANPMVMTEEAIPTMPLVQPVAEQELPVAVMAPTESTGGGQVDPYQQASDDAAAKETGQGDPAITQVPTREEQIAAAKRQRPTKSTIIHEAGRWISQRVTSALGSLSVQAT